MDDEPIGRARGGHARAEKLTPERRSEIARQAAAARHEGRSVEKATHGSSDHPLKIGEIEIPCYVLEDGRRVLSLGGMVRALGMSIGGAGRRQGDRLYQFATQKSLIAYLPKDLLSRMDNPIRFQAPTGGTPATGYEATILPDLCEAVLAAREDDALRADQLHIAKQCEILVRGLARVGIIALVDEATGYQRDRAHDALSRILEAFIAKELQPYVPTFPNEYYEQIFRLRGLDYPTGSVKRPQYFGMLTNDIIYKRLAPGVLDELKKVTPRSDTGRHKDKLFQRLTSNKGYPKLRELLGSVVTIMSFSRDWKDFMQKLDQRHARYGDQMLLPLEYQPEKDHGTDL
ncbi:P63C domain-containing protein [Ancylobacter radicis]|uniref:P63C domain-containing protein n=1 Tax=Ancylobacter radicis TaxID=2836179 RepID=A0ABS5R5B3_9HYPH|nr:P63C domain-containing protein [Ancylobacter radicis]MBS9476860.1 P63C domain-containing protein [Ancylobacter radicis]